LLNGKSGISDDVAERASSEPRMVRNNGSRIRLIATEHHMAAFLAAEDEPGAFESSSDFTAG
jgi:hypothetical protein